jgi:hypothetical protein
MYRLALYPACIAAAVGTALLLQNLGPSWDQLKRPERQERPVVTTVDLSRLAPEIRAAVETAREGAVQLARRELEALHLDMMHKVDTDLLDWYFRYGTQQRLALTYAANSSKAWVAGLFVKVDPDQASRDLQREIAREFELRVMAGPVLEQHLRRIAQASVSEFVRSLQDRLQEIPKQYQVPPAEWDAYLERITFMIAGTEATRSVPLTLKAFSAGALLSGAAVTAAVGPFVATQLTRSVTVAGAGRASAAMSGSVGRQATAAVSRQLASRGLATGAGTWGGALTGGVVLAALVAWEAWDHSRTVTENKPLLRNNIDRFLRLYEADLVEPHGTIGSVVYQLETQIAANIPG